MVVLSVFVNILLPVFLIAGAGAALQRIRKLPAAPIAQATLFLFSPALSFQALATTTISLGEIGRIVAFALLLTGALYVMTWAVCRGLRADRGVQSALLMAVMFMNSANYLLPVVLLAFGEEGLSRAVVFMVTQVILTGTVGVYLASRSNVSVRQALLSVLRVPMGYAALAGLLVGIFEVPIPGPIASAIRIMAGAAVPSMLTVLGIQLYQGWRVTQPGLVAVAAVLRMVVSVGVAYGITTLLGLDPLTRNVLLVGAAMPTAVVNIVLATEFKARPELLTSIVMVTTLASIVTVTALLSLLGVQAGG